MNIQGWFALVGLVGVVECTRSHVGPESPYRLSLQAAPVVHVGGEIRFDFLVTNVTNRSLYLNLVGGAGDSIMFDVRVYARNGCEVWRRAHAPKQLPGLVNVIVGGGVERVLRPRAILDLRVIWNLRDANGVALAPGSYTAVGILPTDGSPAARSAATRFRIAP